MLSPFLRAQHHWYRGERREALACLEEIVGDRAFYVSEDALASRAELTFDAFVIGMLASDHHLMVQFAPAVARLWDAFPGHYAIDALEERGDADAGWLYAAAADGLLSTDPADYDRVAKVVIASVPDGLDGARLQSAIAAARADGAWERYVRAHADVTASLLLSAAFYRARVMPAAMVLGRLDAIAEAQPELLDPVADTLAGWDPELVARVGMRLESGSPDCAASLVEALRRRDFDALPGACLP